MNEEKLVLGRLNPHPSASRDRWAVWRVAIEDFLWPQGLGESDRQIKDHRIYSDWSSDLGIRLGLFRFDADYFERYPTPIKLIQVKAEIYGGDAFDFVVRLPKIFKDNWRGLVVEDQGLLIPASRKAHIGMKFCLLINVLRYGVQDGSGLVKWSDAVKSASWLLALSVLSHHLPLEGYDFEGVSWNEVKSAAVNKLNRHKDITDVSELKDHSVNEGMSGFSKRLKACMDESAVSRVSKLAVEFERRSKRSLLNWRKDSEIGNWFLTK